MCEIKHKNLFEFVNTKNVFLGSTSLMKRDRNVNLNIGAKREQKVLSYHDS